MCAVSFFEYIEGLFLAGVFGKTGGWVTEVETNDIDNTNAVKHVLSNVDTTRKSHRVVKVEK